MKLLLISFGLLGCLIAWDAAAAQTGSGWSPPVTIMETNGTVAGTSIALIADRSGRLHLFFPHQPDDALSTGVDYMSWDGERWSQPANILVNRDDSSAQAVRATIDDSDTIHLVWLGGKERLYYASAPADTALSPHSWSVPVAIAEALPTEPAIAAAPQGAVIVAFASATQIGDIALLELSPDSRSWMPRGAVVVTDRETLPGEVVLAIDDLGRMHLTWTTFLRPESWPPTAVYYARSTDLGRSWDFRLVAEGDYGQSGVIATNDDEVHVFWNSTIGGDGTFHQWSSDGGETWSLPERFIDQGGFSGLPSLAVDSARRIHYLKGDAKYALWNGAHLGPNHSLTDLVCSPILNQGQLSCGERAQLAITSGNQLHVVFETDFDKLWYTFMELELPALPPPAATATRQVPAITAGERPQDDALADRTPPAEDVLSIAVEVDERGRAARNQVNVLIWTIVPPLFLVIGVAVAVVTRNARIRE